MCCASTVTAFLFDDEMIIAVKELTVIFCFLTGGW